MNVSPTSSSRQKPMTAPKPSPSKPDRLTPEGRAKLRATALRSRLWEHSTGPRTPEGKARSAANGRRTQKGPLSVRQMRAMAREAKELVQAMEAARRTLRSTA
jgi:hypothetical protein